HRRRAPGLRCHVSQETGHVVTVRRVRVSSPARTFVELATTLGLVDLVVVGDHLARRGLLDPEQLREFCRTSSLAGAVAARRAASYVRDRVDSPMETRVRMLLVLAGLPEPEVNVTLRDVDGTPLRRHDLSYPTIRVAIEYDGRHHVERVATWERDLDRREAVDDSGWRMLVVTSRDVYERPSQTLARVHRLLLARRMPGVPGRLRDTWRPHFPERD